MRATRRTGTALTLVGAMMTTSTMAFSHASQSRLVQRDRRALDGHDRIMTRRRTISILKASGIPPPKEDLSMSYGERSRIFRRDVFGCKC